MKVKFLFILFFLVIQNFNANAFPDKIKIELNLTILENTKKIFLEHM